MARAVQRYVPPPRFASYEVRDVIGVGGMATVYRGEHTLLRRPVAIKFLQVDHARTASARERFLREARLVARLQHPNLVTVYDLGELDDGTYYQASELINGPTLQEHLQLEGALPAGRALRFARQLARGLACAHEVGVIDRDLKPSNVMLVADRSEVDGYRLKILDFGIAKCVDRAAMDGDLTRVGTIIGTPGYMSPEQCLGDPDVGATSDVYSLGVVLYVMLCGRPPFVADDRDALMEMHVHATPPRPSETVVVPPAVDEMVLGCLAKERDERPRSMDAVIAQIDDAVAAIAAAVGDDDGSTAERAALAVEPGSGERRPSRRWQRAAIVAAAILAAGVVIGLVMRDDREPAHAPPPAVAPAPPPAPPVAAPVQPASAPTPAPAPAPAPARATATTATATATATDAPPRPRQAAKPKRPAPRAKPAAKEPPAKEPPAKEPPTKPPAPVYEEAVY